MICSCCLFNLFQVRDTEPSSIVAYTLCSFEYKEHLFNQDLLTADSSPTHSINNDTLSDDVSISLDDQEDGMKIEDDYFDDSGDKGTESKDVLSPTPEGK